MLAVQSCTALVLESKSGVLHFASDQPPSDLLGSSTRQGGEAITL